VGAGVEAGVAAVTCGAAALVAPGGEFKGAPTAISQRWPGFPCSGFSPAVAFAGLVVAGWVFEDATLTVGCGLVTGKLTGGMVIVDVVFAVSLTTGGKELLVVSGAGVIRVESIVVFVSVESVVVVSDPQEAKMIEAILAAKKNLFIFFS
jgi:hypothetical protein